MPIDLDTLVHIIENGSYEARAMAFESLQRDHVEVLSGRKLHEIKAKLSEIAERGRDLEAAEAAEAALELLSLRPGGETE